MSKYANLPDIDTEAPDVYETEDVPEPTTTGRAESDDEDAPTRGGTLRGGKPAPGAGPDELDNGSLNAENAAKRFRKAERRRAPARTRYTYPPSPTTSNDDGDGADKPEKKRASAAQRLHALQAELAELEAEAATAADGEEEEEEKKDEAAHASVDPGEMLRELAGVRGRLERIQGAAKARNVARERLVNAVIEGEGLRRTKSKSVERERSPKPVMVEGEGEDGEEDEDEDGDEDEDEDEDGTEEETKEKEKRSTSVRDIAEMDRRVGQLEELVGSASTSLDETSPMPPPLLPMLTRLNSQLTLLTQPRHIDAVSRRLKLLLSDLDRVSAQHARRGGQHAPGQSLAPNGANAGGGTTSAAAATTAEQLAPVLTRLVPLLPHVPHVLARLRTLAALHASAAEFESALGALEGEQRRARGSLDELEQAVADVEQSLAENRELVKGNVEGLEARVARVMERLDALER